MANHYLALIVNMYNLLSCFVIFSINF